MHCPHGSNNISLRTTPARSLFIRLWIRRLHMQYIWGHQFRCDRPNNWRMYRNLQETHSDASTQPDSSNICSCNIAMHKYM